MGYRAEYSARIVKILMNLGSTPCRSSIHDKRPKILVTYKKSVDRLIKPSRATLRAGEPYFVGLLKLLL